MTNELSKVARGIEVLTKDCLIDVRNNELPPRSARGTGCRAR
jgi:hypothetical protein